MLSTLPLMVAKNDHKQVAVVGRTLVALGDGRLALDELVVRIS